MPNFTIIESANFKSQMQTYGGICRFNDALIGLRWALERKPYLFGKIETVANTRMAKIGPLSESCSDTSYYVKVFFKLGCDHVELLWMEAFSTVNA